MAANKKAVQVRIDGGSASQAGHQRAHDLRIGPQPDYVDATRSHLNRVLIEPQKTAGLREICETRRSQRQTQRAMKSNAAICVSGIITFGHEAHPIFAALSPEKQDEAYREVAEAVASRIGTTVSGLVAHRDEAAHHAHFQCPGFTLDGKPVSQVAKREALRDIQTLAAQIMSRYAPGIERGKSRRQRIAEGEDYAATVHKTAADMRDRLPAEHKAMEADIQSKQAKRDELTAKIAKNEKHLAKTQSDLEQAVAMTEAEAAKVEKLRNRAATYERRAEKSKAELAVIEGELTRLRSFKTELRAENDTIMATGELLTKQNAVKTAENNRLDEALAQKKTKIDSLRTRLQSLNAA